jgi:hypothetical protein
MAGTKAGAKKGYQTKLKKYDQARLSEIASMGGKAAQAAHPELQRFRDKEFARQMAKRSHRKAKENG